MIKTHESTRKPFTTSSSLSPCFAIGLLSLPTFSMKEKLRSSFVQREFSLGGPPADEKLPDEDSERVELVEFGTSELFAFLSLSESRLFDQSMRVAIVVITKKKNVSKQQMPDTTSN